ncbi:MAG: hypothetical protein LUI04_00620 [Porphyromonadaceae bacterium]|nr:hypothetical protein [Porphyromonadaceae bacterium]
MSFVKSILQQWRERPIKKTTSSDTPASLSVQLPNANYAEQHLVEAIASQINDALEQGETISNLNTETIFRRLAEGIDLFKQELYDITRNELSEKWEEKETQHLSEISKLQKQNAELSGKQIEIEKRYASAERLRKTLSTRIHDLENELVTARSEYERDIEDKLRQINKIKVSALGINAKREKKEEEKVFDCRTLDEGKNEEAVVVKHRYASLVAKLNKAQDTLQELRKENRNLMKRDSRHQQRIKELQAQLHSLRKGPHTPSREPNPSPITHPRSQAPHRSNRGASPLHFTD